jgi:hypothetical protein
MVVDVADTDVTVVGSASADAVAPGDHKFHHDEHDAVIGHGVVHGHDGGIVEPAHCSRLAQHPLGQTRVATAAHPGPPRHTVAKRSNPSSHHGRTPTPLKR